MSYKQAHRSIQRTETTHLVRLTKAQGQRDGLHKKIALFPPLFSYNTAVHKTTGCSVHAQAVEQHI